MGARQTISVPSSALCDELFAPAEEAEAAETSLKSATGGNRKPMRRFSLPFGELFKQDWELCPLRLRVGFPEGRGRLDYQNWVVK